MTDIYCYNGRPGSQKTFTACRKMATTPRKFLYAVDRNEVFEGRKNLIRSLANLNLEVAEINQTTNPGEVRKKLKEAAEAYKHYGHIILIITHEALLTSDLSGFLGWELVIDENPVFWKFGTIRPPKTYSILKEYFHIKDNRITLRNADLNELELDDNLTDKIWHLGVAAKHSVVQCDVDEFTENQFSWWSVYGFSELEVFKSVTILANSFSNSMSADLMRAVGFNLIPVDLPGPDYTPRHLTIRYFSKKPLTHGLLERKGKVIFGLVADYFRTKNLNLDFWSCNNDNASGTIKPMRWLCLPGQYISPKVAGSNAYIAKSTCAIFYSAKPNDDEVKKLEKIGITRDSIIRSREIEDIIQFITRMSLRDARCSKNCVAYVFDEFQAAQVKSFFDGLGIPLKVDLEFIDLHLPTKQNETKRGAGKQNLSDDEKRANKATQQRIRRANKRMQHSANKPFSRSDEAIFAP